MTQCEIVLRHLNDFGQIDQLEAIREYGIMRLASRINDLRNEGHKIKTEMTSGKNRYGEKTSYAVYSLEK